jgi:hypothetical protein
MPTIGEPKTEHRMGEQRRLFERDDDEINGLYIRKNEAQIVVTHIVVRLAAVSAVPHVAYRDRLVVELHIRKDHQVGAPRSTVDSIEQRFGLTTLEESNQRVFTQTLGKSSRTAYEAKMQESQSQQWCQP